MAGSKPRGGAWASDESERCRNSFRNSKHQRIRATARRRCPTSVFKRDGWLQFRLQYREVWGHLWGLLAPVRVVALFCSPHFATLAGGDERTAIMATLELKPEANEADRQWTPEDVVRLFRKRADQIEARLPATEDELKLLSCLTRRRADGRLLRVRKIAKLLGRSADEIHDTLATLERKGLVARPSMESETYQLEVLESGPSH